MAEEAVGEEPVRVALNRHFERQLNHLSRVYKLKYKRGHEFKKLSRIKTWSRRAA